MPGRCSGQASSVLCYATLRSCSCGHYVLVLLSRVLWRVDGHEPPGRGRRSLPQGGGARRRGCPPLARPARPRSNGSGSRERRRLPVSWPTRAARRRLRLGPACIDASPAAALVRRRARRQRRVLARWAAPSADGPEPVRLGSAPGSASRSAVAAHRRRRAVRPKKARNRGLTSPADGTGPAASRRGGGRSSGKRLPWEASMNPVDGGPPPRTPDGRRRSPAGPRPRRRLLVLTPGRASRREAG